MSAVTASYKGEHVYLDLVSFGGKPLLAPQFDPVTVSAETAALIVAAAEADEQMSNIEVHDEGHIVV